MNKKFAIKIPDGLEFSELHLSHAPNGDLSFDWRPVEAICSSSGLDLAIFRDQPEDNLAALITSWYAAHIEGGGVHDQVADALIEEVMLEDLHGGGISHKPAQA